MCVCVGGGAVNDESTVVHFVVVVVVKSSNIMAEVKIITYSHQCCHKT